MEVLISLQELFHQLAMFSRRSSYRGLKKNVYALVTVRCRLFIARLIAQLDKAQYTRGDIKLLTMT
jgi:hypothetical protein